MKKTNLVFLTRALSALALLLSALASTLPAAPMPTMTLAPLPLRTAQAASGSWTQTEWTTPVTTTVAVAPSGTNQYFRLNSGGYYGQLVGTFGVCAGAGAWCQGPGDTAGGQTLRLIGNHKSDAANPYSSDLNGDGISELLIADFQDNNGNTPIDGGRIFWGQGTPTNPSWSAAISDALPTIGATAAIVADLNGDGLPEVIFANAYHSPSYSFNTHIYVYWGLPGGLHGVQYSSSEVTSLFVGSANGISVADLNNDGRPELISVSSTFYGVRIFWGSPGGPHGVQYSAFSQLLSIGGHRSVIAADLNGDGLSELITVRGFDPWWTYYDSSYILWGQPGGTYGVFYSDVYSTALPSSDAFGASVADLNDDGLPEVIFANWRAGVGWNFNTPSYVYWGQAGGPYGVTYTTTARTDLPSFASDNVVVADVDNDGERDVVLRGYYNGFTRVFWGPLPLSGTASISWTLPISSGGRGLSLSDLNGDGQIDLFSGYHVFLHNGNNSAPYDASPSVSVPVPNAADSYASFSPQRGSNTGRANQRKPTYGAALANYGVLESMVMDSGKAGTAWLTVTANTGVAAGTGITLFVAASDNLAALSSPTWTQVGAMGNGSWTQSMSGVSGRYARYRVILWRDRTTEASPALQDITFNYETIPVENNKQAPANGAVDQPASLMLSWTVSSDATYYEVCYDTTLNGTCGGMWQSVGNALNTWLSGLAPGTQYEWQVRACNIAGCNGGADNGVWWTFRTLDLPGMFGKSAPADGATDLPASVTLSWSAPTSGTVHSYWYCYATAPGCVPTSTLQVLSPTTSVGLSGLTPGTTYYWQVRACADSGCTVFTDADGGTQWSYTVAATPGSFGKVSPADGAVNQPINLTLSWSAPASGTVDHYRYCNSTTSGCTPNVNVGTNTSVALSGLTPGTTYYWQVRACADSGCTVFTDADGSGGHWSFSTQGGISFVNTSGPTGTRKEVTPTVVRMGELVSYTIVISNAGSADVAVTITDTLAVSATLVGATPGYLQSGQTLVWSGVNVPAGGTAVLTITVRAGSGPLPGGYTLANSVTIGAVDGEIVRDAPAVTVEPWRAFVPIVMRPPDLLPRVFIPIVMRP
jgi:uncharacterized repeat protein (TIGR01451 family)